MYIVAFHSAIPQNVMQFWLDQGVDGFRLDAVAHLFEDEALRDEMVKDEDATDEYSQLDHKYTFNLPEVLDVLREFRIVLDKNSENSTKYADSLNNYFILKGSGELICMQLLILFML